MILTYADGLDRFLLFAGLATALVSGLGLPSFVFIFGDVVDAFQPGQDIVGKIRVTSIELVGVGVFVWVMSFGYFTMLTAMADRVGKKTKIAYLKSILQQEIAWFDKDINATELPSRLAKECQAIQKAIGDKMGSILLAVAMCVSGLFFAFFRAWLMSLILLCGFPFFVIATALITSAFQSGFMQNLKSYGQSAGYAEQALNAIKVVQAFGQEQLECSNYHKYLGRA